MKSRPVQHVMVAISGLLALALLVQSPGGVAAQSPGGVAAQSNPVGTWLIVAEMRADASPYLHQATALTDGRVLITANGGGTAFFDPTTRNWVQGPGMTTQRSGFTTTLLADGRVLVAGGIGQGSAEIFNPVTNSWSPTGSMSTNRARHSAVRLANGQVLVVGGYSTQQGGPLQPQTSAEIYDPATGSWRAAASASGSTGPLVLLKDGTVLFLGTTPATSSSTLAQIYNPTTNVWSLTSQMTADRVEMQVVVLNDGRVLTLGGMRFEGRVVLASAEWYDPTTGRWIPTDPMIQPRWGHTATLLKDGRVMVEGGSNGRSAQIEAEVYDPSTGRWAQAADMTYARQYATATLLQDGRVLVAGGDTVGGNHAELFIPGAVPTATPTAITTLTPTPSPSPTTTRTPTITPTYSPTPAGTPARHVFLPLIGRGSISGW